MGKALQILAECTIKKVGDDAFEIRGELDKRDLKQWKCSRIQLVIAPAESIGPSVGSLLRGGGSVRNTYLMYGAPAPEEKDGAKGES